MKPSDNIAVAVYGEQVAAVYWQMPIALGANFVNAALTAAVLTPIAARPVPPLWFGVVVLVTVGRAVVWRRYRRGNAGADAGRWALPATLGAMFAGLCWGLGGAVLFPFIPPLAQAFLTIVIGGMCAGSVVLSGPHLPTLLAFVLPACIPMAARFLAEGTPINSALGAMIVVFVAAMTFAGRHLNRMFVEAMRFRFELNEANLRLQAEISERRATEAALHQAQKLEAVGHLTGGIAHDFNNLLTVVIGNLMLARGRAGGNVTLAPLLDNAMQAAERGVAQIQRLLGFARRQRLDPRSVDLSRLVTGINALLGHTLGPGIDLLIAADSDLAPAHVDANQLELAILNLAINARDAMPLGGSLRIGLENHATSRDSPPELTLWKIRRHIDRRHRDRDGRGNARPGVRSVFHHEGCRLWPGTADGPGFCRTIGWCCADQQQPGRWNDGRAVAAASRRATARLRPLRAVGGGNAARCRPHSAV